MNTAGNRPDNRISAPSATVGFGPFLEADSSRSKKVIKAPVWPFSFTMRSLCRGTAFPGSPGLLRILALLIQTTGLSWVSLRTRGRGCDFGCHHNPPTRACWLMKAGYTISAKFRDGRVDKDGFGHFVQDRFLGFIAVR